jgi:flagellar motor switch protein FliN/FliY
MNQPINPTGADLASFEKLTADPSAADAATQSANGDVNLEVILEVPVTLSMEVGRTRIPIRNLLQLNQGSVVELDRAARWSPMAKWWSSTTSSASASPMW